jgi:hypothetical protein
MGKLKLIDDMDSERQTENKSSKVEVHKPQPCQLPSQTGMPSNTGSQSNNAIQRTYL